MGFNTGGALSGAASGASMGSMAGPWGAAIGGVAGGLMGGFGGGGDAPEYDPYWAYTPEQKAMHKAIAPRIQALASQGPQLYGGDLFAEMTPEEASLYSPTRANLMTGTLDQMLTEAGDVNAYNNRFNEQVANPTYQDFLQNIAPQALEGYSNFSTAYGNKRANMLGDIGRSLMTQRFAGQEAAKDRALNAMGQYGNVSSYMGVPRLWKQYGLEAAYKNYVQGNESYQKNIDNALSFLGISSGVQQQGEDKNAQILSGLGALAQNKDAFAGLGGKIGGLFGGSSRIGTLSNGTGYLQPGQGLGNSYYLDGMGGNAASFILNSR